MAYSARILADSISPVGIRLTTMEITYPRFVHSEFMTHRVFSRNAASSRAIPIQKMIQRVLDDPVLPVWWGKNQAGMQAAEELAGEELAVATYSWLAARDHAVQHATTMTAAGLHKQIANRLLEPWMWITVIVSATEWENFFALRCHPDAQPELRKIAEMMRDLYRSSDPERLGADEWHLPLVERIDVNSALLLTENDPSPDLWGLLCKVSVGRCARVSYLTHDGKRDLAADVELHDRLMTSGHWSPFEHVATPMAGVPEWSGNFYGWAQYRKGFLDEDRGPRT